MSAHHLRGYEGDVLNPTEAGIAVPEILQLEVGASFEADLRINRSNHNDPGNVGWFEVGLDSSFALSNPLFSIAPTPDHSYLRHTSL